MTTTSKDLACLGGDSFRLDLGLEESALMAHVLGNGMENWFLCDLIIVLSSFLVLPVDVDFFVFWTGGLLLYVRSTGTDGGAQCLRRSACVHVVIIFEGVVVRFQKGVGVLGGAVLGVRELLERPCLREVCGPSETESRGAMEGGRGARV